MTHSVRRRLVAALAALGAAGWCGPAGAQGEYPSRPLRIVVPYAAGGGADILARLIGHRLSDRLKQPVVVENRGGASNTIGMQAVAAADKEGYTLGLATPVFVMTPALAKAHPYDPLRDFVPVGMIGFTPLVLVVHPSVPARNTVEFIALAKSKPGKLNFASLGPATTQGLAATMFNAMTGIEAVQVPYKGSAPGVADLLAGNVQFMFNGLPSMLQLVQAGKLRALATTAAKRAPQLPGVPTVMETVPGYEVTTWYSLVAPAGTPAPVVERLNQEIVAIVGSADMREKLAAQGLETDAMKPDALARHFRAESEKWARVIRDAGIPQE